MTNLILAGYAYSALVVTVASCVVIAGRSASAPASTQAVKGTANVIIVLSNTVITIMLIYGAVHT